MSVEELNRKYHELCGWRLERWEDGLHGWIKPGETRETTLGFGEGFPDDIDLPKLHLNANLAIAEADRVFTNGWSISRGQAFTVKVWKNMFGYWTAPTLCEAILKALIAAKEAK